MREKLQPWMDILYRASPKAMSLNASGERWRGDEHPIMKMNRSCHDGAGAVMYSLTVAMLGVTITRLLLPSGKARTCALAHCAHLARNVAGCAGINDGHERSSTR